MCSCPPTRGQIINRRAWLGSQIHALRSQIPDLEKQSRRTPPKTLVAERQKVEAAKIALADALVRLPLLEAEYNDLRTREGTPHRSDADG